MNKTYSLEQLIDCLTPIFERNNVHSATLFGSYAKGNATNESDVDLAVDSGLHGLSFFGLLDDVCRALSCEVDMIDKADIIPGSPVEKEILRTGVVIYEQKRQADSSKNHKAYIGNP